MRHPSRPLLAGALAAGLISTALAPAPAAAAGFPGAGDPYFPGAGNGGIDVQDYHIELDYTPPPAAPAPLAGDLGGTATISLTALEELDAFNLDLREHVLVEAVTVGGAPAEYDHDGDELTVVPPAPLAAGASAVVVVDYAATTGRLRDEDGVPYGWVTTRDGAVVVNQADGASTWFPANDHPSDKATYSFDVTVPEDLTAVANGLLVGTTTEAGRTTWSWDAPDPMASYLATASIGHFELVGYTTDDGLPVLDAVDADLPDGAAAALARTPEMIAYLEGVFGPYPFAAVGGIVDDDSVGYALETQTRPIYSRYPSERLVAHELAHQWVGNAVTPATWQELWLSEGWATYATWLWSEHDGGRTVRQSYDEVRTVPADDPYWEVPVGDPGTGDMFAAAIYGRSAATLHALRLRIGDDAFFTVAREWFARNDDGHGTTPELVALAEEVSGQELDAFFDAWLYTPGKPAV